MKVALITGGNRGIGKNTALNSAKRGMGVILTYRSHAEEAQAVVDEIEKNGGKARALKLDISDTSSFPSFIEEVKKSLKEVWNRNDFDALVNNAGFGGRELILETSEDYLDELYKVHIKGPFFLTQKLYPLFKEGGSIVNISSGLTRFTYEGTSAYAMMKGAVEVFTRSLAKEFSAKKIRVNTVAPGAIDTDFGGGKNEAFKNFVASQTALGKIGDAEDVGIFIASLLSDDSRFVNAQRIEISGGIHL